MTNEEKLINAFCESLMMSKDQVNNDLIYGVENWDSIAHMALVATIEEAFDIMISTEDVINLSGFAKSKEILETYGVSFND
jgi:acyl carrier protein